MTDPRSFLPRLAPPSRWSAQTSSVLSWEPSIHCLQRDKELFRSITTQDRARFRSICGSQRHLGSGRRMMLLAAVFLEDLAHRADSAVDSEVAPAVEDAGVAAEGAMAAISAARSRAPSGIASRSA